MNKVYKVRKNSAKKRFQSYEISLPPEIGSRVEGLSFGAELTKEGILLRFGVIPELDWDKLPPWMKKATKALKKQDNTPKAATDTKSRKRGASKNGN